MHLRSLKQIGVEKLLLVAESATGVSKIIDNTVVSVSIANMSTVSNSMSQLNDLRSYSRHWLGEFIDLYQAEECLWQPKHPDYSNHSVRNKAYDKLVEKLKEVEPNPDRAMVVRKINSLRSAFRREYRKSSSKANYETRLWYYDKLLFIAEQNTKRLSGPLDIKAPKRSLPLSFDDDESMEFVEEQQLESSTGGGSQTDTTQNGEGVGTLTVATDDCVTLVKEEHHHHSQQQQQQQQHAAHTQEQLHHHHTQLQQHQQQQAANAAAAAAVAAQAQPQHTTAVKVLEITSLDSNSQREIQQAVSSFEHQHQMQQQLQHQTGQTTAAQLAHIHQQVPTIQISREHLQPLFGSSTFSTTTTGNPHRHDDEFDAIGMNVASKLRVMNPTQRIIAEKLISDVLFNGQLDNLSINSSLTQ